MAYSKKNRLMRIIDIQNIYKEHSKHHRGGCTDRHIYRELIFPQYRISERTFYEYLAEPGPKKQLNDLETENEKQMKLFDSNA